MATTHIKQTTILSFITFNLLILQLPLRPCTAFSTDIDDGEDYIVDTHLLGLSDNARPQRLLFQHKRIRKGAHCVHGQNNICHGIPVNKGTGLLQCCKKHCRNVLGDRNNCGGCGRKCSFGEQCCNGVCTNVAYDADHCGKCRVKCASGVKCEYGVCGYA